MTTNTEGQKDLAERTVRSTSDLTPRGLGGYRKTILAVIGLIGAVLSAVQPYLTPDTEWAKWVGLVIAVIGAIGVYFASNAFQPLIVADAGHTNSQSQGR